MCLFPSALPMKACERVGLASPGMLSFTIMTSLGFVFGQNTDFCSETTSSLCLMRNSRPYWRSDCRYGRCQVFDASPLLFLLCNAR